MVLVGSVLVNLFAFWVLIYNVLLFLEKMFIV